MLQHVAIIMDGNRRWAKEHKRPTLLGHKEGSQRLKEIISACSYLDLKGLTVYAFSTENWKRSEEEVGYLMRLMADVLRSELEAIAKMNVQVHPIGHLEELPDFLQKVLKDSREKTKTNTGLVLQLAINYGGRAELLDGVKRIAQRVKDGEVALDDLNEGSLGDMLFDYEGLPHPDLVIRTSGEQRLSNFLIWQAAYSELYFTPTHWPDFNVDALITALNDYFSRKRRFGG